MACDLTNFDQSTQSCLFRFITYQYQLISLYQTRWDVDYWLRVTHEICEN